MSDCGDCSHNGSDAGYHHKAAAGFVLPKVACASVVSFLKPRTKGLTPFSGGRPDRAVERLLSFNPHFRYEPMRTKCAGPSASLVSVLFVFSWRCS